jgi:hypothetical protein
VVVDAGAMKQLRMDIATPVIRPHVGALAAALLALIACASPAQHPNALASWLDDWESARRCWVGTATYDLEAALAVGELSGRRCRMRLSIDHRELDAPLAELVERANRGANALRHERDVTRRARVLDQIDRDVARLYQLANLDEPTREVEEPLEVLDTVRALEHGRVESATEASIAALDERLTIRILPHHQWETASSHDGGRTWTTARNPPDTRLVGLSQDPDSGTIELLVERDNFVWLFRVTTRSLPTFEQDAVELGTHRGSRVDCRAGATSWIVTPTDLLRVQGRRVSTVYAGWNPHERRSTQLACAHETAIVLRHDPDVVERCTGGACERVLEVKHSRRGAVSLTAGGWVYAASLGGVVGIWQAHGAPRFYRVADGELEGIRWIDGAPYLAFATSLVRLPSSDGDGGARGKGAR